jgi:hypothetical protein
MSPSLAPVSLRLTLGFADVTREMDANETQMFESSTKAFLSAQVSNKTIINDVTVVSQEVRTYSDEGFATVVDTDERRRWLQDADSALFADVIVEGTSEDGTFEEDVESGFADFESYVDSLGEDLPLFQQHEPVDQAFVVPSKKRNNKSPNWWLLGAAVGLSIVAVGTVWFVRKSRHSRQSQSYVADGSMVSFTE